MSWTPPSRRISLVVGGARVLKIWLPVRIAFKLCNIALCKSALHNMIQRQEMFDHKSSFIFTYIRICTYHVTSTSTSLDSKLRDPEIAIGRSRWRQAAGETEISIADPVFEFRF